MSDTTIVTSSPVGRHLDSLGEGKPASYLMFNQKKVELVAKIAIQIMTLLWTTSLPAVIML